MMAFAYVATVPSAMVFSGFFFLDFFFQNRPHPKKKIFFFFGENFCDVEKKNFFWARQRDKWHFVARLESLVALVALIGTTTSLVVTKKPPPILPATATAVPMELEDDDDVNGDDSSVYPPASRSTLVNSVVRWSARSAPDQPLETLEGVVVKKPAVHGGHKATVRLEDGTEVSNVTLDWCVVVKEPKQRTSYTQPPPSSGSAHGPPAVSRNKRTRGVTDTALALAQSKKSPQKRQRLDLSQLPNVRVPTERQTYLTAVVLVAAFVAYVAPDIVLSTWHPAEWHSNLKWIFFDPVGNEGKAGKDTKGLCRAAGCKSEVVQTSMRRHMEEQHKVAHANHVKVLKKALAAQEASDTPSSPVASVPHINEPSERATPCSQQQQPLPSSTASTPRPSQLASLTPAGGYGFDTYLDKLCFVFCKLGIPFRWLRTGSIFRDILPQEHLQGANIFPAQMSTRVGELREVTQKALFKYLQGKDVYMMVDGATVARRTFLGISICDGTTSFYLRSVEIKGRNDAKKLTAAMREAIALLRRNDIYVFSVVADNASSMQKALRELRRLDAEWLKECEVVLDNDGTNSDIADEGDDATTSGAKDSTSEDDSSDELVDECISSSLEDVENDGIFVYRCSTHSLQLVLKDMMQVPRMGQWKKDLSSLLKRYQERDLLKSFEENQGDNVKQLIRPTEIRWNSVFDCAVRLYQLKEFLLEEDRENEEFWGATVFFTMDS